MRSHFPIVELGKYVRQVSQRNRAEINIEVFSVTNSEGFARSTDYFSKEVFSKNVSNYKVVSPGQFAYNPSRINVGSIDYLRHSSPVLVSPLYIVFEGNKDIHADYLLRYLRSAWGNAQIRANTEGAVRDSLKFKGLENIKIPRPPVDDQVRIATLLGKVEGLIARRKQHLQQLDDLLRVEFREMFGNVAQNTSTWKIDSLSNLGNFKNGLNFGTGDTGVRLRCLGVGDFKALSKIISMDSLSTINLNHAPSEDYFLQNGDLVFVRSNGSKDLVGRCIAVYPNEEKVTYSGFCIRFRLKPDTLDPTYLVHLFRSPTFRKLMLQGGQGANIQNINQKSLSDLPIPVPPPALQRQFSKFVEKVEGVSTAYRQSLTELETLYGALSQKAFMGELDFSRLPLPGTQPEKKTVATAPVHMLAEQELVINFPGTDDLLETLKSSEARKGLIAQWLEVYRGQLGRTPFSVQRFMVAAQTRLEELNPNNDVALGASDYEHIKAWVFEALAAGRLDQVCNITEVAPDGTPTFGNRIELWAVQR
jgi:type I restriction enzyme, S subunit